ncbi:Histidine kinase [Frankia sp. AiPs1]|uniref:sensor histidine kinase n=1 Tax=Frankia sp. AiPa1 TaxID=573492 RepID=UPI00202B5D02|nr:ATP-binding protein [Frankia sp. AiPa1]MCL9762938.1 ATP-binding protein [Frankia sp. AiPa1]
MLAGVRMAGDDLSLAAGVLRVAAALPSSGPRAGDLTPLAAWLGPRIGAREVVIRVHGPQLAREHAWSAPPPPPAGGGTGTGTGGGSGSGTASGDRAGGPGVSLVRPVLRLGAQNGTLAVHLPSPPDAALTARVTQVAAVLGPVLGEAAAREQAIGARLRHQQTLARIADARYRTASQMESERHGLERDLHDGAQLHLVSLQLALAVLAHRMETGEAGPAVLAEATADLRARLNRTHRILAETAAGVPPGPLRDEGLAAALTASFQEAPRVTLDIDPRVRARRYPSAVENAMYLACLEAVNNALKHASGTTVTVTVSQNYQGLRFEVVDVGPGLDDAAATGPAGVEGPTGMKGPTGRGGPNGTGSLTGLGGLRARLEAVGGTLRVSSEPGTGTRLTVLVPF